MSTNAERIAKYKAKMKAAGFQRVSIWLHPDAVARLAELSPANECYGRTLERILLGNVQKRPGEIGARWHRP